MRQTISIFASIIFAFLSGFLVVGEEFEKVERARHEAKSAIENISGSSGYYYGTAASIEDAFANTLWGGSQIAKKYAKAATNHATVDYYYNVEGDITRGGMGMAAIPAEKINPATKTGVTKHFQETAMMFLENKPYDSQQPYGFLLAIFFLKLLAALGPSLIPFLLSVFAKPLWFAGLAAVAMLATIAVIQPANAQKNLLRMNVSVQDANRSVTPVLFHFWDGAYGFASVTPSAASIGAGPSWSVSDSLAWAGKRFNLAVSNAVGLDHDGNQLVSIKLWNVMNGGVGKLNFYSKSFLSFPTWRTKPSLGLSANHITYSLTDKFQLGWRTKNVLVKTPKRWLNNWRMGLVGKLQLSDTASLLMHYAPMGSNPAARLEMSVMF